MKRFIKNLYDSRLGEYLLYCLTYTLFWKLSSFELTMIVIGGTILGELNYQYKNKQ